jgi:nucleotide-binding universal stress UspA family protein
MKILLPVDGSEFSHKAIRALVERPWPGGSQVEVLSVAHPVPEYPETQLMGRAVYLESLERETKWAQKNVDEAAAEIGQAAPSIAVTTKVAEGSPQEKIVEEASLWEADLILMGCHGYNSAMRLLLGSVSHAVALHAPCSVEIVRTRKAAAKATA